MALCPLCRLELKQVGRLIEHRDARGFFAVFPVCQPCRQRLDRLPERVQHRQHSIAVCRLAARPEHYNYNTFSTVIEARLFRALEVERLSGILK